MNNDLIRLFGGDIPDDARKRFANSRCGNVLDAEAARLTKLRLENPSADIAASLSPEATAIHLLGFIGMLHQLAPNIEMAHSLRHVTLDLAMHLRPNLFKLAPSGEKGSSPYSRMEVLFLQDLKDVRNGTSG